MLAATEATQTGVQIIVDTASLSQCRQRGCVNFGLWHTASETHRARTLHTALATVTLEKSDAAAPWSVFIAPHGESKRGPVLKPPDPSLDVSHAEHMELRAAVLYALRTAIAFNN